MVIQIIKNLVAVNVTTISCSIAGQMLSKLWARDLDQIEILACRMYNTTFDIRHSSNVHGAGKNPANCTIIANCSSTPTITTEQRLEMTIWQEERNTGKKQLKYIYKADSEVSETADACCYAADDYSFRPHSPRDRQKNTRWQQ
jgi:hypothetical protein